MKWTWAVAVAVYAELKWFKNKKTTLKGPMQYNECIVFRKIYIRYFQVETLRGIEKMTLCGNLFVLGWWRCLMSHGWPVPALLGPVTRPGYWAGHQELTLGSSRRDSKRLRQQQLTQAHSTSRETQIWPASYGPGALSGPTDNTISPNIVPWSPVQLFQ